MYISPCSMRLCLKAPFLSTWAEIHPSHISTQFCPPLLHWRYYTARCHGIPQPSGAVDAKDVSLGWKVRQASCRHFFDLLSIDNKSYNLDLTNGCIFPSFQNERWSMDNRGPVYSAYPTRGGIPASTPLEIKGNIPLNAYLCILQNLLWCHSFTSDIGALWTSYSFLNIAGNGHRNNILTFCYFAGGYYSVDTGGLAHLVYHQSLATTFARRTNKKSISCVTAINPYNGIYQPYL